ncbi:unnamed protein product, partial [Symbiodinium necroappetens]
ATCTKFRRAFAALSPFRLQIMKGVVRALERSSWQLRKTVTELVYNIFHGFAITLNEEGFGQGVLAASGYEEIAADTALPNIKWPSSLYHIAHRLAHP